MRNYTILSALFISIFGFNNLVFSQWIQTNGPGSGSVGALAVRDSLLITGIEGKGIFYSFNQGGQWNYSNTVFSNFYFLDLFIHDSIVLAGTEKGIFISHDKGQNWLAANNGFSANYAYEFAILGEKIFVGSDSGIFVTEDLGNTWVESDAGISNQYKYVYSLTSVDSVIYGGTINGVVVSKDSGVTWIYENEGLPFYTAIISLAAIGDTIFAGATMPAPSTLYRKIGNNDWVGSDTGLPNWYIDEMVTYNSRVFALSGGVFQSNDGGSTWFEVNDGLPDGSFNTSALALEDSTLICGKLSSGVYKANVSSVTWSEINNGLTASFINALLAYDDIVFSSNSYGKGMYETLDEGNTWIKASTDLTANYIRVFGTHNNFAFAGTEQGLFMSSDPYDNWSILTELQPASLYFYSNSIYIGTYQNGMHKSMDDGNSWSGISEGLPVETGGSDYYYGVLSIAKSPLALMAGTEQGLYISIDDGENWTNAIPWIPISALIADGNIILAGSNTGGLFRSVDGGLTWITLNADIGNDSIHCFLKTGTYILAGTQDGIYISNDGGDNWIDINMGFPSNLQVQALSVNSVYLYAGTSNSACWKRSLIEIPVSVENNQLIDLSFHVRPNPTSSLTTIDCKMPLPPVNALIQIYNSWGQTVRQFPIKNATTEIELDVNVFPDGIYFILLNLDGKIVRTEKMIVSK